MLKRSLVQSMKLPALLALVYCLLFNSFVVSFKFDYYKANLLLGTLELLKDLFYICVASFVIFYGLSINKFLLRVASLFLFFTSALASYALYFFKISPTKQMIRVIFENEAVETFEVLSMNLILWIIFACSICVVILWRYDSLISSSPSLLSSSRRRGFRSESANDLKLSSVGDRFNWIPAYAGMTVCLTLFIWNIFLPNYKILMQYFPIQYLHNTYLYISERSQNHGKIDISREFNFIDHSKKDIVGILVIGESARYDHFSVNGYSRKTTPLIEKTPNLYSFKAQACANITYLSVPCLLTKTTRETLDKALYETTFLSVLTKLGFQTSWIGTQSILKYLKNTSSNTIYDEVGISIIPGGSALYEMNAHDEVILPYLDNLLSKEGKKFIVIHTSGSHWNYVARYPEKFEVFKPVCESLSGKTDQPSCGQERLINSYDNSIIYTDYILDQVIKHLEGKNAFLIYASDHGESLGERGIYAHGSHMIAEQTTIPFIFWGSGVFTADHPELKASLKELQKKELSHDYIFHSVLDCLGVESDVVDKNLSLCK